MACAAKGSMNALPTLPFAAQPRAGGRGSKVKIRGCLGGKRGEGAFCRLYILPPAEFDLCRLMGRESGGKDERLRLKSGTPLAHSRGMNPRLRQIKLAHSQFFVERANESNFPSS